MVSGIGFRAVLAAAMGVGLAGIAPPASACSPPEVGWYYSLEPDGPANGVISLSVSCGAGCSPAPQPSDLTLRGLSGDIPGTVTVWGNTDDRYFAFKPPTPLTAGQTYWVTVAGARDLNDVRPVPSATIPMTPRPALAWSATPAVTDRVVAVHNRAGRPCAAAVVSSSAVKSPVSVLSSCGPVPW